MTTYQIVMNEEELEMFETIRSLRRRQKASRPGTQVEKRRLSQTILIYGRAGDRMVGPWDIAAENAILELATVGKELMATLTSDEWNAIPELTPELEDDRGSLSDLQGDHELLDADDEEEKPLSWAEVKRLLPSFVTKVSFTVDGMKMSPADHSDLEDRFPDIDVRYLSIPSKEEASNISTEIELPKGVRRAIFELDEVDEETDLVVTERIKKQFPWAETRTGSIALPPQEAPVGIPLPPLISSANSNPQTVDHNSIMSTLARIPAKSNSAALRVPSSTEPRNTNVEASQLANRHLMDFKRELSGNPGNQDLDYTIQLYRNGKSWNDLSNSKKEAIAHARCIQTQYGQFVTPDKKCSNCMKMGNMCRVYIADLQLLANINLGHGCQYCRISNTNCDVKTPNITTVSPNWETVSISGFPMPTSSNSHETKCDQTQIKAHTDLTAFPQPLKRKPALEDQTTEDPKKIQMESVTDDDNHMFIDDMENDLPGPSLIPDTPQSAVYTIANKIGLEMSRPKAVEQEYNIWLDKQVIRSRSHNYRVEDFYSIIVDLCIIGFHTKDTGLQEAALLRFQKTTVEYTTSATWPPLKVVMKAFDHLPQNSALRRWIEITHSFLWNTSMYAPYEKFKNETNSSSDEARAEFMFGLANGRCRHTEGGEIAVLEAWCDVHNHRKGGIEERICKAERDKSSRCPLDKLIKRKEEEDLKFARRLIKTTANASRVASRSGSLDQDIQARGKPYSLPEGVGRGGRGKRGGPGIGSWGSVATLNSSPGLSTRHTHNTPLLATSTTNLDLGEGLALDSAIDDVISDPSESIIYADSIPTYRPSQRIEALYQRWIRKRTLALPSPSKDNIPARISTVLPRDEPDTVKNKKKNKAIDSDTVYEDLLDLSIYALHQTTEDGFEHEVLVQWQMTDFSFNKFTEPPFPHLNLVEKAYRELPHDHDLLSHIARFFACFQATHECETPPEYRPRGAAFETFLAPYGRFTADSLLWNWCKSHHHTNMEEIQECHRTTRDKTVNPNWKKEWDASVKKQTQWWQQIPKEELNFVTKQVGTRKGKGNPDKDQANPEERKNLVRARALSITTISSVAIDSDSSNSDADTDNETRPSR